MSYSVVQIGLLSPAQTPSRSRLLEAARQVFLECGYQKATVAEIARRARMSKATVYELVGSKPELFLHAAMDVMEEATRDLLPALDVDGPFAARPEDAVDALLHLLPNLVETCPLFLELWTLLAHDDDLRARCFQAFRDYYLRFGGALAEILERAAPGAYRPGEALAQGMALLAAFDGLCYQWLFFNDRILLTRVGAAIRASFLASLPRPADARAPRPAEETADA